MPPGRPLKIAVVTSLPTTGKQFGTRNEYTSQLHDYLRLGRGTLIIVTARGVSAATPSVSEARITAILSRYAQQIKADPAPAIKQTVAALDAAAQQAAQQGRSAASAPSRVPAPMFPEDDAGPEQQPAPDPGSWLPFLLVPIGLAGGLALIAVSRGITRAGALRAALLPVRRRLGEIINALSYTDAYLDLLPDSPQTTAAREARQRTEQLIKQVKADIRYARAPEDYARLQTMLDSAGMAIAECRRQVDLATGGTGIAVAIEGTDSRATPTTGVAQSAPVIAVPDVDRIPLAERGACFFCSRPTRISDLTPITLALNGRRRKVLACAEDVRIIQQSAVPQIRTVTVSGRPLPWYTVPHYDPYRDYSSTQVTYMPGYGGYDDEGGLAEGFLLGTLLSDPAPMPYPMFVMPDGQISDNWQAEPPPATAYADASTNMGGIDFGSNSDSGSSGGFASIGNTNVGGVDFSSSASGSSGGSDFSSSGSDFSSGSDSGGGGDY